MASMFKKPKRNFRRKGAEYDNGNDEKESHEESMEVDVQPKISPSAGASRKKKEKASKDPPRNSSKLSFGMDEDENGDETEVFQVKKSSHSRRIAKQMKREKKEREKEKARNGNGSLQLKSDTNSENEMEDDIENKNSREKSSSSRRVVDEEERAAEEAKAEERIRRLREEFRTLNGEEAEAIDGDGDVEDGQGVFKAKLARGEIPDAKTIHFIRKQRQMARETDFIPIQEQEPQTKSKTSSRLVRDDDNDKSDDEEDDRVDFTVNKGARERQQMRDDFLAAEHGSDEDSDQEREWEKQQIRKATSLQIPGMEAHSNSNSNDGSSVSFRSSSPKRSMSSMREFKPFSAMSKSHDATDITIESVRKRLEERLTTMDTVFRSHKMELDKINRDVVDSKDSIESCKLNSPGLENRYRFFQELRGYVRDLVECLNEKVPILTDLEQRMKNLLKARAVRLLQRRQQDVQDQCRDYMTSTAKVKIDKETQEDQLRQRRAAEREARRSRRRRIRESKNISGHHDGLSSDEEESSQSLVVKFNSELEDIRKTNEEFLEDVVEEFSNMEAVKDYFEKWKFSYDDSYREAYIGLCLPKLLNPFIRRELLAWNPLDENCPDFEDMPWFNSVVFMGFKEGADVVRSDDDLKILPSIVEKIILPKVTFLVESVWDPLSTTQTARLVRLTHKLIKEYPTVHARNKNFRTYVEAVVARLKKTLDDDVFMPMYPLSVLDNRSSGPAIFFHRQSWTCIKLLGNILSWHQVLSVPVIQQLALSGLLNRYIVVGLVSSHINREALHKCQAIISTFPKEWFAELDGDSTLPQLENFCRYLLGAARTLHKATALENDSDRLEGRDLVKQMSKHLVNIHAMDHATALASEFSFKIGQV